MVQLAARRFLDRLITRQMWPGFLKVFVYEDWISFVFEDFVRRLVLEQFLCIFGVHSFTYICKDRFHEANFRLDVIVLI